MSIKEKFSLLKNNEVFYPSRNRLKLVFCFILLLFFTLTGRIIYLATLHKETDKTYYASSSAEDEKKDLKRASIVDRTGVILATDIVLSNFFLNRELISDPKDTSDKVKSVFPDINKESLLQKIINPKNKSKYILIKRNITKKQQDIIKNSGILGFEFEDSVARIYPHKNLFSHIVGYVDVDRRGIAGLEKQYNNYLNNSKNSPLILTLDSRIQSVLRQQLLKGMKKYNAKSMIGIVTEVKTGNVLAIVSLPDFDPNQMKRADKNVLFNKATYGVYEMGSIFKVFTVALGLDKELITQDEKFDVSQVISYGKYEVKQEYFGKKFLNAREILEKSSNIGAGLIGLKVGTDKLKAFLDNLGLFERVPSNFPSLAKPIYPKTWRDVNTLTISYGYGMAVTPLHVVSAVNGIVNNGVMLTPRFVRGESFVEKNVINPQTSQIINAYLRNVVRNGTGWRANTLGYSVGGKTGSARLLKDGEYQEGNIMANFIGIFPMNNPYFSVYVMVESPVVKDQNIEIAASNIAAPLFSRIVENIAPILNVVPYIDKNAN